MASSTRFEPQGRLLVLMHVKYTIPYLHIQLSSWRWTLLLVYVI